ncbi:hypothetical protein BD311DRAFT_652206 [Dichomitus squalens]|uniref:Uncharacterized protein n=1 Tax=Dichomitus squalens TaxID=114155 RepID=A0A4Q9N0P0_9APHY|nr:hypothetical protein BD311DRAFT_652206 [Dichomitus squalens]
MTWIHTTYIDHADAQDSLIAVIPELSAYNASALVFRTIARKLHLSAAALISKVRSRSCGELLRDAGANMDAETRTRTVNMLLKLLRHLPRDHDPSIISPMDVLWSLWELAVGASAAEEKLPALVRSVLDGVAGLVNKSEPFRLRRAALNLLHEGGLAWTYSYNPTAIGGIMSFAKDCYQHDIPDLFMKACVVALLPHWFDWKEGEPEPYHRQQLQELLRDLTRTLRRSNEEGTRYDVPSASRLVSGLAALAEKDPDLVEPALPEVLLESLELGFLDLSGQEHVLLQDMLESTRSQHHTTQRTETQPPAHLLNGEAIR